MLIGIIYQGWDGTGKRVWYGIEIETWHNYAGWVCFYYYCTVIMQM